MIESNVWLERAGLFELLAKSFSFPAFDLAAALASGEYSQASREVCHAWGITDVRLDALLERVDDKYAGDEDTALHALRIEYTRLFIGTREPLVSPYGSYWKAIAEGRDPVLFLSRETSEVESAMHAAGGASHSTILRASLNSSSTCARLKGALKSRAREPQWARVCTRHS